MGNWQAALQAAPPAPVNAKQEPSGDVVYTIGVFGDSGVGKTSIIQLFTDELQSSYTSSADNEPASIVSVPADPARPWLHSIGFTLRRCPVKLNFVEISGFAKPPPEGTPVPAGLPSPPNLCWFIANKMNEQTIKHVRDWRKFAESSFHTDAGSQKNFFIMNFVPTTAEMSYSEQEQYKGLWKLHSMIPVSELDANKGQLQQLVVDVVRDIGMRIPEPFTHHFAQK